jgi:hypothetical protein
MNSLVRVMLKYGLIAGAIGILLVLGLYYIGRHPFLIPVFFDFRIIFFAVFVFFALKEFRQFHHAGILYLWQGMIGSFILIASFAVVAAAGIFAFIKINPHFLSSYIDQSLLQLRALPEDVITRIGKDVYQRNLEMLPSTNGFDLAMLYFTQSFMIGIFVSIILSVILRRHPKT